MNTIAAATKPQSQKILWARAKRLSSEEAQRRRAANAVDDEDEESLEAALEALYDGADEEGYGYEDMERAQALVAAGVHVIGLRRPLMDLFYSLRSAMFDD